MLSEKFPKQSILEQCLLLSPQKTSEIFWFSHVFQGNKKGRS